MESSSLALSSSALNTPRVLNHHPDPILSLPNEYLQFNCTMVGDYSILKWRFSKEEEEEEEEEDGSLSGMRNWADKGDKGYGYKDGVLIQTIFQDPRNVLPLKVSVGGVTANILLEDMFESHTFKSLFPLHLTILEAWGINWILKLYLVAQVWKMNDTLIHTYTGYKMDWVVKT